MQVKGRSRWLLVSQEAYSTNILVSCFQDGICDLFHKTICSMERITFFGFSVECWNKLFCKVMLLVLSQQLCVQVSSIGYLLQLQTSAYSSRKKQRLLNWKLNLILHFIKL